MTAATGLSRIHQISIRAHDVERAVRFYRDTLGLPFLFAAPPRLAFFDCDGIRLMLSEPEGEVLQTGSVLYFRVNDIERAYRTLRERGAALIGEPNLVARLPDHELWLCFLRDPDGNPLALMEEKRP